MRDFSKTHKLDYVCYDIRGPVMDAANEMEAQGEKILKLNIGNPAKFGFSAPDYILKTMSDSLPDSMGYSDSRGIPEAGYNTLLRVQGHKGCTAQRHIHGKRCFGAYHHVDAGAARQR